MTNKKKIPRSQLLLKAVLLWRKEYKGQSKTEMIASLAEMNDSELENFITDLKTPYQDDYQEKHYTPCSTFGDYSPSNPWDAPGMSISDFI